MVITKFIMKKLITLFITILILVSLNGCSSETMQEEDLKTNVMQISANDYEISAGEVNNKLTSNQDFYLIDVRTEEEHAETQIPNAELMVLDNLADEIINNEDISFHDEIVVYCRSGNRSKTAYDILTQLGYKNVKSMAGGISEWTNLGYNTCSELSNTC